MWPIQARTFRFSIAYEIVGQEVVIVALVHQRRRPGYWFARKP